MKNEEIVTPNTENGECIWHAWNATESFFVLTKGGIIGSRSAHKSLTKEYGKIYMDITYSATKSSITREF